MFSFTATQRDNVTGCGSHASQLVRSRHLLQRVFGPVRAKGVLWRIRPRRSPVSKTHCKGFQTDGNVSMRFGSPALYKGPEGGKMSYLACLPVGLAHTQSATIALIHMHGEHVPPIHSHW
jgi:hypothetical protein